MKQYVYCVEVFQYTMFSIVLLVNAPLGSTVVFNTSTNNTSLCGGNFLPFLSYIYQVATVTGWNLQQSHYHNYIFVTKYVQSRFTHGGICDSLLSL